MNVSLPDSLKPFVDRQAAAGNFESADQFVADLVAREAKVLERVGEGHPLPADEHFTRRLSALLDEAETSGEPTEATREDFDAIEQEALEILRSRGRN